MHAPDTKIKFKITINNFCQIHLTALEWQHTRSGNIITRTYLKTYYEEPPKGDLESGTYFDN